MGFLDFLNGMGSAFGALTQYVSQIFALLWNVLTQLFNFLWNNILALADFLVSGFQKLARFFVTLWANHIKPFLRRLGKTIDDYYHRLKHIAEKVNATLRKLKEWYDKNILKYQLGVINLIQRVRMFLTVLRLFHVKWAEALDAQLARIQSKITESIQVIRGTLNEIISTFGLIFEADLLIRRNVLGATLLTHLGSVKRILGYGSNRILTGSEQKTMEHNAGRYSRTRADDHTGTLASTGLTEDDKAEREAARKGIQQSLGQALPF